VLEIIIDGLFGTHRIGSFFGGFYDFLIGSFEILAIGVLVACVVFIARRAVIQLPRFHKPEMKGWPSKDAMIILITEIVLMCAFLTMNAADLALQELGAEHYAPAGSYPVSSGIVATLNLIKLQPATLVVIERGAWWLHIIGILGFLNYLVVSKHLHILLAFPNVWYSKLEPRTQLCNMPRITGEVKSMLDPSLPPPEPAPARTVAGAQVAERFGAKDIFDLSWKSLMDAYSCTECGRCTSECPANLTGKLLSPRKIMMDTRDRLEEVGKAIDAKGKWEDDGQGLHHLQRLHPGLPGEHRPGEHHHGDAPLQGDGGEQHPACAHEHVQQCGEQRRAMGVRGGQTNGLGEFMSKLQAPRLKLQASSYAVEACSLSRVARGFAFDLIVP
jgi:ferredoxin